MLIKSKHKRLTWIHKHLEFDGNSIDFCFGFQNKTEYEKNAWCMKWAPRVHDDFLLLYPLIDGFLSLACWPFWAENRRKYKKNVFFFQKLSSCYIHWPIVFYPWHFGKFLNIIVKKNQLMFLLNQVILENAYRKIACSKTSRLEGHAGFFRLLRKGIFDPYVMWPFDKKLIS